MFSCLPPALNPCLLPFSAGSLWDWGPQESLVPSAKWHYSGVGWGQKSLPSLLLLPSPGNYLSNTLLAYLPTPRERGTRAEVLPHPMQGKGLLGTALPRAWSLLSAGRFP